MRSIVSMLMTGTLTMVTFGALLFVPAGTFDYWQAWVFLAVIGLAGWVSSIFFLRTNPAVLQRRLPATETRALQKAVARGVFVLWAAMLVISALDHRFRWSTVPAPVSLLGDALIAVGVGAVMLVLVQNGHAAATVRVAADQRLVSTGLYGVVRHPMYTSNAFMLIGTPLALGSLWGLLFAIPCFLVFALRIRDEETLLREELAGYREYTEMVRYRLVPYVW